ncbi:hypothetical protein DB346_09170 [Verrucomicrobia bacterium LW23]|nr:hypothetical protein DB346_09170 [Verrucomicrobia bacterium LW23]
MVGAISVIVISGTLVALEIYRRLDAAPPAVVGCAWHPDGNQLAIAYHNGRTDLVAAAEPEKPPRLLVPASTRARAGGDIFCSPIWSNNGRFLIGQNLKGLRIVDMQDVARRIEFPRPRMGLVRWNRAEGNIVKLERIVDSKAGKETTYFRSVDLVTGASVDRFTQQNRLHSAKTFLLSQDCSEFAEIETVDGNSPTAKRKVTVRRCRDNEIIAQWNAAGDFNGWEWSPDGKHFAIMPKKSTPGSLQDIVIVDAMTGKNLLKISVPDTLPSHSILPKRTDTRRPGIIWSSDSRRIGCAILDSTLDICCSDNMLALSWWNASDGTLLGETSFALLDRHYQKQLLGFSVKRSTLRNVSWSPDLRYVAAIIQSETAVSDYIKKWTKMPSHGVCTEFGAYTSFAIIPAPAGAQPPVVTASDPAQAQPPAR